MPRRRQQLTKPCPKCGSDIGFVYLQTWAKSNYKKKIDYETGEKYLDYDDPVKKKLLVESDPIEVILSEGDRCQVNSILRIWMAFKDVVPQLCEKYRDLLMTGELEKKVDINSITKGIDLLPKTLTPLSPRSMDASGSFYDNRSIYGMDLLQWFDIARSAQDHSYRETARKSGMSVNSMKKQLNKINATAGEIVMHCSHLSQFISRMRDLKILSSDNELRSQFEMKCKAIVKKSMEDQFTVIKRAELEARNSSDTQQEQKKEQRYRYYQIVHGKKTKRCGPFKESDMPLELLIQYRAKHGNRKVDSVNDQDYKNNMIKINSRFLEIPKRLNYLYELYLYLSS